MTDSSGAEAMIYLTEILNPMHEFVSGQRAQFEREGFSPAAAEAMAMATWPVLMAKVLGFG